MAQAINLKTLDYVVLLCEELPRMKAFYHEILGFPIERDWEGWIEMRARPVFPTLRPRERPYDGPKSPGAAGVPLAFHIAPPDVETRYQELLQKKVEILKAPRDHEYGHRTSFFKEPEGNILEIYADI